MPTKHELVVQRQEANSRAADLERQLAEAQVLAEILTEGIKEGLSHLGWRTSERVHEGEAVEALTGALDRILKGE